MPTHKEMGIIGCIYVYSQHQNETRFFPFWGGNWKRVRFTLTDIVYHLGLTMQQHHTRFYLLQGMRRRCRKRQYGPLTNPVEYWNPSIDPNKLIPTLITTDAFLYAIQSHSIPLLIIFIISKTTMCELTNDAVTPPQPKKGIAYTFC